MTAPSATKTRKPAAAKYISEPLVTLSGGPRHRWWYTLADWKGLCANAEERLAGEARESLLGYQPTERVEANPDGVNAGKVWQWAADTVAGRQGRRARR